VAATPSVKISTQMPFKGATRVWTNRYHFNGGVPADAAHWNTFFDAVVNAQKAIIHNALTITLATGYLAGSDLPVASKAYTTAGTLATPARELAGETVALCRWSTAARSVKNHAIYLFSYWHGVGSDGATTPDKLWSTQRTAMQTYAAAWISGFSDGTNTYVRAGPNGATATGYSVEQYVTHRDFPYSSSV
jgi:hypothetical protein